MSKITNTLTIRSENLESLEERTEQLGHELMPKRDLWPGVEQAINYRDESTGSWRAVVLSQVMSLPIAVSATACVAMLLLVLNFIPKQGEPLQNSAYQYAMENAIRTLEESYQLEKQQMLVRFQGRQALTDNWRQQMQDLQEAKETVIEAMIESPENMQFIRMLKNIHQQELMIIERSHERELDSI